MTAITRATGGRDGIDRDDPTPMYRQLEQIVRTEIARGSYRPGDLLPTEYELCTRYDVSRSVVRQALGNLAHDGIVRTERGRGTFVAEPKLHERFVQRTTGFYEDLTRMGLDIETQILRQELADVPIEVAEFLGVDRAIRIDRLRAVGGRVLTYVVTYLPPERCPDLEHHDLTNRSLYVHLREAYGLEVYGGSRTVEAVPASDEVAPYLEVEEGAPVLLLRSAGRTEDGRPLEWFEAWHRADRTLFEVEIVPGEQARPFKQRVVGAQLAASTAPSGEPGRRWAASGLAAALEEMPVVAVARAPRYGDGLEIARGLVAGGIRVVEFTLTGAGALDAIERAREAEAAVVGAGSVTDLFSARRAIAAGAQFLVCPAHVAEVAELNSEVPVMLAGLTPTELLSAWRLTGMPVKLFPAELLGPEKLRAVLAPMPWLPLVPSGGIDESNAGAYLAAGALAVNVGSALCPPDALVAADREMLAGKAQRLVDSLRGGADGPAR